jgi:hypothetical protein
MEGKLKVRLYYQHSLSIYSSIARRQSPSSKDNKTLYAD